MTRSKLKNFKCFILGAVTFAIGYFIVSTFVFVERPTHPETIEDWGQICFWSNSDGISASVSPKGCFSTSCSRPRLQAGTAIVDVQAYQIQLETRFIMEETSRFPLPCIDNCAGGGRVNFNLGALIPDDYQVRFKDRLVGDLMVLSGKTTPRQCFDNNPK